MRIVNTIVFMLLTISLLLPACGKASTTEAPSNAATTPSGHSISIVSVTSPVNAGSDATLVAQTTPGAFCGIQVSYKSGPSLSSALSPKPADSNGRVSWTWQVESGTEPGDWQILVVSTYLDKMASQHTHFTVR
jgi:hypothetical protein